MLKLSSTNNYIIIKNKLELNEAKQCDMCGYIIFEDNNRIYIWKRVYLKWELTKYTFFSNYKEKDLETTGLKAYQSFYDYCGKTEVEKMKHILKPIPMWESCEQIHYANIDYINEKLYEPIYVFDVNSSFTFGTTLLPEGFEPLKDYMINLYNLRKGSKNDITKTKYKNMMNYLIGYFARISEFVSLRSKIIELSNSNIYKHMSKIRKQGGICFLSNTDSIITNEKGAEVMLPIVSNELGKFKLELKTDKLCYKGSNAYQVGDKVVYSGVGYFERKHTDFFTEQKAYSTGTLIKSFNFKINENDKMYTKLCKVTYGEIVVDIYNKIGELINKAIYKIGG